MTIYQDIILDHYRAPHNFGRIKGANRKIAVNNPFCGDKLSFQAEIKKGQIAAIAFQGEGCAISLSSASLLTDYIKGKKTKDLLRLDHSFIIKMLGIELGPVRLKCALLALEGVRKLIDHG